MTKISTGIISIETISPKAVSPKTVSPKTISNGAISIKIWVLAAAVCGLATFAWAQSAEPTPWELKPDTGYAYDKEGKTFQYKMGTNNAGLLLKGAKKVPKGTLFFIGQNGQLYMRTGSYLEGDGKFLFGSN